VIFGSAVEEPTVGRRPLTDRLASIARNARMAMCGGNCMGFLNFIDDIMVGGWPYKYPPPKGHIGFISHSGSSYSAFALNARQLGMTHMISSGQELVTTASDYLEFLLTQQETRVAGCILETVRSRAFPGDARSGGSEGCSSRHSEARPVRAWEGIDARP
jgi:acetate---CoA ligase (ADP-forming)